MVNRWGNKWKQWKTIFLGSKITADHDWSHEIKRCLLLGRKPMTNLESILKRRNIILPAKVHLVKALVFPVVIYGCEKWTINKAELRSLESPLDCKEIKPVDHKGHLSWIFIGRTDAEAPIFWPLNEKSQLTGKDPGAGKDWRQEEKRTTEDEMVGWHHQLNGHEFEQVPVVCDGCPGQGNLACCSP